MKNFDEVVAKSVVWEDNPGTERTYANFELIMRDHFVIYSGEECEDDFWNSWIDPVKKAFNKGAAIQRVVFLDDIKSLDTNDFDSSTSWTLLDLANDDLFDYLEDNAVDIGKSTKGNKGYIIKTHCPAKNVHIEHVPLPHEHSELEINIIDNKKLTIAKVYEYINEDCNLKLIGTLNIKNGKLKLMDEIHKNRSEEFAPA